MWLKSLLPLTFYSFPWHNHFFHLCVCLSLLHLAKLRRLLGSPETQHLTDLPTVSPRQITPSLSALMTLLLLSVSYISSLITMFLYISLTSYCLHRLSYFVLSSFISVSVLLCIFLVLTSLVFSLTFATPTPPLSLFPLSLCSHPVLVISGPSRSPFLSTFLISSLNSQPTFSIRNLSFIFILSSPVSAVTNATPLCLCIAPSTVPPEAAARERPAPEQRGAPAAWRGHQQTIQAPPAATTHGHAAHCRYARKHTLTHPPSIVMTLHDHCRAPSPPPSPLPPNSISRLCSPHRSSGSVL